MRDINASLSKENAYLSKELPGRIGLEAPTQKAP
jgi:hypothetical protein